MDGAIEIQSPQTDWSARPIPFMLIAAGLVADVIAVSLGIGAVFPAPSLLIAYGLIFSQVGLAAIWVGLSTSRFWMRIGLMTVVVAAAFYATNSLHESAAWLGVFSVQSLAIIAPLLVLRRGGLRLQIVTASVDARPWQFTLRHLFGATTICGLLLLAVRGLQPWVNRHDLLHQGCLLGAGFALIGLVETWACLGAGRWPSKLVAVPTLSALVGWLFIVLDGNGNVRSRFGIMALVLFQSLLLTASLTVMRARRHRLIFRR
jgi:hypothetical protein